MNVVVSHWSASVAALAAYAVVAAGHLYGMRGAAAVGRRLGQPGLGEAVAFQSGLLLALLAVVSPLGYWASRFIWIRSVQDVVLAVVAPALMVLGAPWLPLRRAVRPGRPDSPDGAPPGPAAAAPIRTGQTGQWRVPALVTVAFSVVWWGWHLPVAYDAAVGHGLVYAAEVVMYLGAGVLLWLQLLGSRPYRPRLGPLHRLVLVVGTAVSCTVLGLVRVFGNGVAYHAYSGAGHNIMSVLADQQIGGAVLWVITLVPFGVAAVALPIRWLGDEDSRTFATGFDRLLKPPKPAWPTRPGLR